MNLVPRQGGNRFSGSLFGNWANDSLQTSNYTDAIKAAGLSAPNLMQKIWDIERRGRRADSKDRALVLRRRPAIRAIGSSSRACSTT